MLSRCLAQGSSATTRSRAGVSRAPAGQRNSMIRLSLRSGWLIRMLRHAMKAGWPAQAVQFRDRIERIQRDLVSVDGGSITPG